jgi:haloalkane dehalogenase
MFMFPPIELQTTVPETFWSWPSIETLVPPPLGAAVALTDALLLSFDELELSDFLSDEQADRPAMTIAAPPMATTNPRFTGVLLWLCDPSRSADHLGQYGSPPVRRHAIGRRICLCARCLLAAVGVKGGMAIQPFGMFVGMQSLCTPGERFADLPEFPYPAMYCEIADGDGGRLRVAWVEDGPAEADPVLMLHGEPSWSFLYRRMIPILAAAGHRVICPDLVGFGRSDKPARIEDHTYARHVEWMRTLAFDVLDLQRVTLVGQDWGGLIGLRLAAEHPRRFARVVVANTALPTGDLPMPDIWWRFREVIQAAPEIDVGRFVESGCLRPLTDAVRAAYDAPFPDNTYCAGPRAMPGLIPTTPDNPASEANRAVWKVLCDSATPMLVAFSDGDPITGVMAGVFASKMRGAQGIAHPVIANAGHFLQEDAGEELAEAIVAFLRQRA